MERVVEELLASTLAAINCSPSLNRNSRREISLDVFFLNTIQLLTPAISSRLKNTARGHQRVPILVVMDLIIASNTSTPHLL